MLIFLEGALPKTNMAMENHHMRLEIFISSKCCFFPMVVLVFRGVGIQFWCSKQPILIFGVPPLKQIKNKNKKGSRVCL